MKIKFPSTSILRQMAVLCVVSISSSAMAGVVVSNLSETNDASTGIFNSSQRIGAGFTVANTSSFFQFNQITVNGTLVSGSLTDLTMDLYTDGGTNTPGTLVDSFAATNPSSGLFTFTPGSNVFLSGGATYYWSIRSAAASGEFRVRLSTSTAETGDSGWSISNDRIFSGDSGANWSATPLASRFSVDATPTAVPEPSSAMLSVVLATLAFRRRR